jgi:4-amino-4-deoxy-L-arabinose transferase-like glycosyltransferase
MSIAVSPLWTRKAAPAREEWVWRAALALAAIANLIGSWTYGLLDENEGRYAAIAREMLARHDWIVPHLNGVPYLEKPPLLYWALASSIRIFGDHEVAIRLVPWAFHVATAVLTGRLAAHFGGERAGRLATLIFLTCAGVAVIDRTILFDVPMTCFLTAALLAWLRWEDGDRAQDLRWAAAMLALAVLSKGFVVLILAGGTVLVTLAVRRRLHRLLSLFDPAAILIFLLVAAPWHLAATLRQPGFAWFYFINEHVLRFTGTRVPHDYPTGPPWYYIARLPFYLFPWSALLPLLVLPGRRRGAEPLLWAWAGCVILFFSFAGSKGFYYILPAAPPLVVLLALRLCREGERERSSYRRSLAALSTGAAGAAISLLVLFHRGVLTGIEALSAPWCVMAASAVAIVAAGAAAATGAGRRALSYGFLAAAGLAPVLAGVGLVSATEGRWSQRRLAAAVKSGYPGVPVYLYREFEAFSSLPYYLGGQLSVIDCASADLYYGRRLRPDVGIAITAREFREKTREAPALVVVGSWSAGDFQRRFPSATPLPLRSDRVLLFLAGSGDQPGMRSASVRLPGFRRPG